MGPCLVSCYHAIYTKFLLLLKLLIVHHNYNGFQKLYIMFSYTDLNKNTKQPLTKFSLPYSLQEHNKENTMFFLSSITVK